MKNLLFACLTILLSLSCLDEVNAQMLEPVKWTHEVEQLEDGSFKVDFTAKIDEGWYVYSQDLEDGGPLPTTIEFDKGVEILKVAEEKGKLKEGFDNMFEMNIKKYSEKVVFSANIKPLHTKVTRTTASVRFMCCDNSRCLPPTTIDFDIQLNE